MRAHLTRRYWFSASHRLHCSTMSPKRNVQTYGKCNNIHGHGHDYFIEVTVVGPVNSETGMICNLADLDTFVNGTVIERFDHENLNMLPEFSEVVPTTENLCVEIFNILNGGFHHAAIEKVRIEETSQNSFEYTGE